MFKKQKLGLTILLIIISTCIIGTVVYTIIDNRRFIIVEEKIRIDRLPASFDGFKILQISDLHEAYFGEHQANLAEAINAIDYDMFAFTGDMNNEKSNVNPEQSSRAILDLIDGIDNKDAMFWVDGNWGPFTISTICGIFSGTLTPIGKTLQERGVVLLTQPVPITRGEDRIWITPALSIPWFNAYQEKLNNQSMGINSTEQKALLRAIAAYQQINDNGEVKLALMTLLQKPEL